MRTFAASADGMERSDKGGDASDQEGVPASTGGRGRGRTRRDAVAVGEVVRGLLEEWLGGEDTGHGSVPQEGDGAVAVPAKGAGGAAVGLSLLGGANDVRSVGGAVDDDAAVRGRVEPAEPDGEPLGMNAEELADDLPNLALGRPSRVAEDAQGGVSLKRFRPYLGIIDAVEVTQDVEANNKASGVGTLLLGKLFPQPPLEGGAVLYPPRPVHRIAVAGCPFLTGGRAGRPFLQGEREDREALPPALHHPAANLAAVVTVDQKARTVCLVLNAGREEAAPFYQSWVRREKVDPMAFRLDALESAQAAARGIALAGAAIRARGTHAASPPMKMSFRGRQSSQGRTG